MIPALIIILKSFILGFLIAYFEPIQYVFEQVKNKIKSKNRFIEYIKQGLSCHKCLATWIAFYLSCDLYIAGATTIIVYLFDVIVTKLRN